MTLKNQRTDSRNVQTLATTAADQNETYSCQITAAVHEMRISELSSNPSQRTTPTSAHATTNLTERPPTTAIYLFGMPLQSVCVNQLMQQLH